jgi:beta-fructofuranosidase
VYTPRGAGVSELGDIEVVAAGDDLHLFHLTLPNHDVVQHAVSRDGLTWRPLPAALRTGDPGACDDDQIWTMSVTPRPEPERGYVMLYTALAGADEGPVQRIALATSDNLIGWTKSPRNPAAAADPRWYEADPAATGSVSFRDPKPVRVDNAWLATVCAREAEGPLPRRGCVGLLRSDDLETWEVCPPLFAPRRYWDLECPQLFRLGHPEASAGPWYLTAAIMEDRSQRYWLADDARGPLTTPPGGDRLAPAGHYAGRVTRWRGMDLFFAWHQPALDRGWQTTPHTVDWVNTRNPFGKFLAPPLLLTSRADRSLALGSFPGWDAYRGEWRQPIPAARTTIRGTAIPRAAELQVASPIGMDLATTDRAEDDVLIEGMLSLSGARGGIGFRLDQDASGLYVELKPGSTRVALQRWGVRRDERGGPLAPTFEVLQEAERHQPIQPDDPIPLRLLLCGPYVEVSLAGEVAIAFMTGNPAAGRSGVWSEHGTCALRDARVASLRCPGADGEES